MQVCLVEAVGKGLAVSFVKQKLISVAVSCLGICLHVSKYICEGKDTVHF